MMREISMERVEKTREQILSIIKSPELTHEQKITNMANQADSLLEVLDVPEGLDELLNVEQDVKCICDLFEGHAPVRPRYIAPEKKKKICVFRLTFVLYSCIIIKKALNTLVYYKEERNEKAPRNRI